MDDLCEIKYNVRLQTPVGFKKGCMTVSTNAGAISGKLKVLKTEEPFEGTIDEIGRCRLYGTLKSLTQTINFDAAGLITEREVKLLLIDGQRVMELEGEACT